MGGGHRAKAEKAIKAYQVEMWAQLWSKNANLWSDDKPNFNVVLHALGYSWKRDK